MGAGWRLALCTTIPRDRQVRLGQSDEDDKRHHRSHSPSPSPRSCVKLRLFKSASHPSTPRLQSRENLSCRTTQPEPSPVTVPSANGDPKARRNAITPKLLSTPSSPILSPHKFSIFNNTLGLSRSRCGVCLEKVRIGKGTAIYTAECSHTFHFPCVTAHVRGPGGLSCPVCAVLWRDPLVASHKFPNSETTTANGKPKSEMEKSHRPRGSFNIKTMAYDDDEPLQPLSAAGSHFEAIPEAADEGGDDDDDEVRRFFVPQPNNPSTSKPDEEAADLRRIDIRLLPGTALISAGRSHETYAVALRVKAPSLPHSPPHTRLRGSQQPAMSHRAPIDLVTVLDVSGRMTGAKLQMLKRTMRLVISSLGPADRLSVIAFDSAPKRLLPLKRMTTSGQRLARRVIDGLASGQWGSRAAEALRKASKVLEHRRERNPVASIILLSDGQDGDHPLAAAADDAPIEGASFDAPRSTRFAHVEIPVRAFAFGEEADGEFSRRVGGLLSVVVQDVRLRLGFAAGSVPAEVTAVYSCHGRPTYLGSGNDAVSLGNLYAEEERELLVELRVPVSSTDVSHSHSTGVDPVMSIRCSYRDPGSLEPYGNDHVRVVPRPSPRSERLRSVFITARAVAESRRLREDGEPSHAQQLLSSARGLLAQAGGSAAADYVRCLDEEMAGLHSRRRRQQQQHLVVPEETLRQGTAAVEELGGGEAVTRTPGWRALERFVRAASTRKSTATDRVGDLHGFENARF